MDEGKSYDDEWEEEVKSEESGKCRVVNGESSSSSFY